MCSRTSSTFRPSPAPLQPLVPPVQLVDFAISAPYLPDRKCALGWAVTERMFPHPAPTDEHAPWQKRRETGPRSHAAGNLSRAEISA